MELRPTDSTKLRYSTDVDLRAVQWAAVGVFGGGTIDKINPKAVLAWSLVGFVLVSASRSIAAEKALVAYYAFDEGSGTVAGDLSGKRNDATIHGAAYVKVHDGYALSFDGKDDYVDAGGHASLVGITGDLTIEAWAMKASPLEDTTLVSTSFGRNDLTRRNTDRISRGRIVT